MHLNSRPLIKRLSTADLPILPFLAPRVFKPWRSGDRQARFSAQASPTRNLNAADLEAPQSVGNQNRSWRPLEAEEPTAPADLTNRSGAAMPQDRFESATSASSNIHARNSKYNTADSSPEDEFKKRYGELWGDVYGKASLTPTISDEGVHASGNETVVNKKLSTILESASWKPPTIKYKPSTNRPEPEHTSETNVQKIPRSKRLQRRQALAYDRRQVENNKLPKRPLKLVSWTPGDRSHMLEWQRRFAFVDAHHQDYSSRVKFTNSSRHDFSEASKEALIEQESSSALRAIWDMLPEKQQDKLWPELICTALVKHPNAALKVLSATYTPPYPPDYAVSDCLDFIIFHYLVKNKSPEQRDVQRLLDVITYLLQNAPSRKLQLSQHSVYTLISRLEYAQVKALYELLHDVNHPSTQHTLMHFTYQLSKSGDIDKAFSILKRIGDEGEDLNSPRMASVCAHLLQRNGRIPNATISNSQIFEFMLRCGIKPNLIIYNILLQNSFKNNDHETGWQIYDMMSENSIEADEFTYSILLNDSKLRRDEHALNNVVQRFKESDLKSAHIATDLLHAIFLITGKDNPSRSSGEYQNTTIPFEKMLTVYCEYFNPQALAQIIPFFEARFGHLISQDARQSQDLMHPPPPTLRVMLTGLLMDITTQDLTDLYNWFRILQSTGDPAISWAMQSTQVYNSFIMAFGQSTDTLDWCPRIIGDMVSSIKAISSSGGSETAMNSKRDITPAKPKLSGKGQVMRDAIGSEHSNTRYDGPAPDIYTWSILLYTFISHGQARAAEKVLTMMESRGVTPSLVTWNSLVAGYARMQDISMTADTVDRLEKAGFQPNDFTMKGIAGIHDNRALIEAMKAKEETNLQMSHEAHERSQRIGESLDKAIIDDEHLLATGEASDNNNNIDQDLDVVYLPIRKVRVSPFRSETDVKIHKGSIS